MAHLLHSTWLPSWHLPALIVQTLRRYVGTLNRLLRVPFCGFVAPAKKMCAAQKRWLDPIRSDRRHQRQLKNLRSPPKAAPIVEKTLAADTGNLIDSCTCSPAPVGCNYGHQDNRSAPSRQCVMIARRFAASVMEPTRLAGLLAYVCSRLAANGMFLGKSVCLVPHHPLSFCRSLITSMPSQASRRTPSSWRSLPLASLFLKQHPHLYASAPLLSANSETQKCLFSDGGHRYESHRLV